MTERDHLAPLETGPGKYASGPRERGGIEYATSPAMKAVC